MDATDIIEAFGGDASLAQDMGMGRTGVYIWRKLGIPHRRCLDLAALAKQRGLRRITLEVLLHAKPRGASAPVARLDAAKVIDVLGGVKSLAADLDVSARTVARWRTDGFPAERLHQIAAVARKQGRKSITLKALIQIRAPPAAPPGDSGLPSAA